MYLTVATRDWRRSCYWTSSCGNGFKEREGYNIQLPGLYGRGVAGAPAAKDDLVDAVRRAREVSIRVEIRVAAPGEYSSLPSIVKSAWPILI